MTSHCDVSKCFRRLHRKYAKNVVISALSFLLYAEISAKLESIEKVGGSLVRTFPTDPAIIGFYGFSVVVAFFSAARFCLTFHRWMKLARLNTAALRGVKA